MIAITGISGYIGCHVSHLLKENNTPHKGIIRKNPKQDDLDILDAQKIPYSLVDFTDEQSLCDALNGVEYIVHLVGSIYKPKNMTMDAMHKGITQTLLTAAKKQAVKKIIYVSALGSRLDAPSDYHRTKAMAEAEIKKSGIPYVILQPSLIFGKKCGYRNSKLVARLSQSIQKLPFIPILGKGANKLQPLFIMDLARCICESLKQDKMNITIELGGPDVMPFEKIARIIAKASGHEHKKCAHIPIPVARVLAGIMEKVSAQPKITVDQVRMVHFDNICANDAMNTIFPFKKISMEKAIDILL
ncbi:MAG: NAD-dependent epimerase/dehydratase family protein [Candidatus Auribacterota bacterium]|jgi:NADH dehydrogenase|nr:NAD-dependent epimerase/dehydratase family protein [Candidatus Auribacterota bacterium]